MKKRINSKQKGNRGELELAKILSAKFGMPFARIGVSSGARPKQVKLDGSAKETFTGDLVVPEGFLFSVEAKAVNAQVDLLERSVLLEKFLRQVSDDAASIGKMPMLCWKRNRRGWLAFIPKRAFEGYGELPLPYARRGDWLICKLDALLEIADRRFWFSDTEDV